MAPIIKPRIGYADAWISHNLVLPTLEFWHGLGFSANGLTTLSALFGAHFLYSLHTNQHLASIASLVVSFYFDYADGMFARKYDQTSNFGDAYDHITDLIVIFGGVYLIYTKSPKSWRPKLIAAILLYGIIASIHHTCYEFACSDCQHNSFLWNVKILEKHCNGPMETVGRIFDVSFFVATCSALIYALRHNAQKNPVPV